MTMIIAFKNTLNLNNFLAADTYFEFGQKKFGTIRSKSRLQSYRSTSVSTGFLWNYYDANEES